MVSPHVIGLNQAIYWRMDYYVRVTLVSSLQMDYEQQEVAC